jgi:hypothetical protein
LTTAVETCSFIIDRDREFDETARFGEIGAIGLEFTPRARPDE